MVRAKGGGAPRGRGKGLQFQTSQSSRQAKTTALDFRPPGTGSHPNSVSKKFSLEEEARNTERGPDFWSSANKLRYSKVSFVSAGKIDPSQSEERGGDESGSSPNPALHPEINLAGLNLGEASGSNTHDQTTQALPENSIDSREETISHAASTSETQGSAPMASFFVDVEGSGSPVKTGLPPPTIRAPSPSPSDSSAEVIIFTGRKDRSFGSGETAQTSTIGKAAEASRHHQATRNGHSLSEDGHTEPSPMTRAVRVIEEPMLVASAAPDALSTPDASSGARPSKKRVKRGKKGGRGRKSQVEAENALLADYIENIQDTSDVDMAAVGGFYAARDLGPSTSDGLLLEQNDGWDSPALQDLDDMSTSDEVLGAVQHIISKREREQGRQYLIVWEGSTFDDAKWIPASVLTMDGATEMIARFEEEEKLVPRFEGSTTSSSDEQLYEQSGDVSNDEEEDAKDEEDLIQRKIDRMTDEKIARLLAKQEELGMGSESLMIFDDTDGYDEENLNGSIGPSKARVKSNSRRKGGSKGKKRLRGEAPSAAAIADAYDGFDVMEWERPSLQKRPKGRHGGLPFSVSDSELEAAMQETWAGDREKKKAKKQEREDLRAQGLLGKKNKFKPDLKAKYTEGMTLDQVKEEVKQFLLSSDETLALPPMDKSDRKMVHDIANAFNLKSKSVGGATSRFPTLYKTSRTRSYDSDTLEEIDSKLRRRRFLPRLDKRSGNVRGGVPKARRAFGGSGNAAAGYRDGEIVGAAAPELSVENRGHVMLQKLGWSQGTALGALDNKGILQPVAHVVKISKAGLG